MALINPLLGSNLASTGFDTTLIPNSAWFDGSADYLTRTPGSAGNRTRWTIAWWFQLNAISTEMVFFSANNGTNEFRIGLEAAGQMMVQDDNASMNMQTAMLFRDVAYYHCIVSYDSNQAEADRVKVFVNGVDQTLNAVGAGTPSSAGETFWNNNQANEIGRRSRTTSVYTNAYMAQILFLDGDSTQNSDVSVNDILGTATFGENGSQRIPKANATLAALATSAGGNSFCLDFADSSNLGNDISGNSPSGENDFSVQGGMGSANQSTNTPSKTYSTFNPLAHADNSYPGTFTLSEGNQKNVINSSNTSVKTTVPFVMSGSNIIRAQFTFSTIGHGGCGITGSSHTSGTYHTAATSVAGRGEVGLCGNGALVIDGNFNNTYTSALSDGDVVDVIVNCNVGAVYFAVDGNLLGGATQSEIQAGTTTNAALVSSFVRRTAGEVFNFYAFQFNPTSSTVEYNSGQSSFTHSYSTITSLISLNTADLPAPTHFGCDAFSAVTYTGNGSTRSITTDIAPALVWIKNRSQADEHKLVDIVRGVQKELSSDSTAAESTDSNGVTAFASSSFSLGSGANGYNDNTENFVAWCWEAGTAWSNDSSATSIGNLDSSGRVSASDAFAIISYTGGGNAGDSIKHGMSAAPEFFFTKESSHSERGWLAYHAYSASDPQTDYGRLEATAASGSTAWADDATLWNDTAPTNSIITLGLSTEVNASGEPFIMYAFRSVAGVCKVGSYVGNGSATAGPYVQVGFRPRWIMVKNASVARDWVVVDTARTATNPAELFLFPNEANAEAENGPASGSTYDFDLLADGFRPLTGDSAPNGNGNTILYVAMADIASGAGLAPIYGR